METNPPLRRLTIAVDAESYGSRNQHGQLRLQEDLRAILRRVCDNGELNRVEWDVQQQGDGELAILPPGTVEDRTISEFVSELHKELHHHNKERNDAYRVRLRVAIHQGNVRVGENGFAGNAVVTVCRMRDNDRVRRTLAAHADSDFVLVVSDSIYTDVIAEGTHDLYRWRFDPVVIEAPDKDFHTNAWMYVPDPATPEAPPTESGTPSSVPGPKGHDSTVVRDDGRDARGHSAGNHGSVSVTGGDATFGPLYGDKHTSNRF